jgi:ribonuclease HII
VSSLEQELSQKVAEIEKMTVLVTQLTQQLTEINVFKKDGEDFAQLNSQIKNLQGEVKKSNSKILELDQASILEKKTREWLEKKLVDEKQRMID